MAAYYTGEFTNTEIVKKESGFELNTDISEQNDVTSHVKAAEAEVLSAVSVKYTLPLSGNTFYSGSSAQYLLQETAKILASGLLMLQQFKGQGGGLEELAQYKIDQAREILRRLAGVECDDGCNVWIKLLDTAQAELITNDSGIDAISGYPNSADDEDDPDTNENAKFTMDSIY